MLICDESDVMTSYLRFREKLGIIKKASKHIFVTSNTQVRDVIYNTEHFQYHGHAGMQQTVEISYKICFAC